MDDEIHNVDYASEDALKGISDRDPGLARARRVMVIMIVVALAFLNLAFWMTLWFD